MDRSHTVFAVCGYVVTLKGDYPIEGDHQIKQPLYYYPARREGDPSEEEEMAHHKMPENGLLSSPAHLVARRSELDSGISQQEGD